MKKIFIPILVLVGFILFGTGFFLGQNINFNNNSNKDSSSSTSERKEKKERKEYNYSSIIGIYKCTSNETFYELILYDNGLFKYNISDNTNHGYIGSFIYYNKEITLVNWFSFGSGVGYSKASGTISLTISDDTINDEANNLSFIKDNNLDSPTIDLSNELNTNIFSLIN